MTIYLSIGSSEDIEKMKDTLTYLKSVESSDSNLEELISWYEAMLHILYNGGNLEDSSGDLQYSDLI